MSFRNVLVVDDRQGTRDVLVGLLKQESGVVALSCANAATALDLLDKNVRIDLLLSEYLMDGMDGLEFASEVRRMRPDLPFVLVTDHDEAIDSLAAGGAIALLKPFSLDTLRSVLREHLQLPPVRSPDGINKCVE